MNDTGHDTSGNPSVHGRAVAGQRWLILVTLLTVSHVVRADDWPQWLGPRRDSIWREDGIISEIPADGLKVKWRVPVSGGYTGPAVAKQRVYVMDYVTDGDQSPSPDRRNKLEGTERILCLDAASGREIWKHEYHCPYEISYPAGPRVTPTVHEDVVYTLGAEGDLLCLNAASGDVVWSRRFKKDFESTTPIWGYCGHPLVDGDKLICIVGGEGTMVVAFDRLTGRELWRSLDGTDIGYSAPTIIEHDGQRQLLIWHAKAMSSLNPENGEHYWSEELVPNYGMAIVTPRLSNDLLFVGGIIDKSMMLRLGDGLPSAQVQWYGSKDVGIDPTHSTPFAEDGILYGVSREGKLSAVEMGSGRILWSHFKLMPEHRRVHSGTVFIVKNKERFFLMTDSGELALANLSPQGYRELGRAKVLEPTGVASGRSVVWSHPAFANKCMFARNDKELVCVSLAREDY